MASLISGNTQIWFSPKPTVSGVYRYDVAIDGEVVFVGNTYLEADKNPIIDVTDILRNFVDVNKPPFTTNGEKSSLVKDVEVTIYIDGKQYKQNIQKFMIYENPFYKSYMSTPILDNFATENIGSMPMLQGWNSTTNQGHLIPTYPAVASDNFTFDMVCGYQNMQITNDFSINYNNGLIDSPKNVQLAGGGVYQYSIPLSWLLRDVNKNYVFDTITDLFQFSTFASYYNYADTVEAVQGDELLIRKYTNTRYAEGNMPSHLINQYTRVYYTNGSYEKVNFRTVADGDGADDYTITYEFTNILPIDHINVYMEYDDGGEEVLTITPNVTNWTIINSAGISLHKLTINLGMKLYSGFDVNESITIITDKVTTNVTATVCDAKSMDVNVFSPTQSGNRYKYTIANFDNESRFFLKWKDRYGMPQCQPFGGTLKYHESIEQNKIVNYQNVKKIIDITNTPKWTLNTKWIKQDLYPFYESIFVSPYLILYDAYEDKMYNVILSTTDYDEKTFKNQNRNLFNLQLEVELDTTEYMIY